MTAASLAAPPAIEFAGVSKSFGGVQAVDDITLRVNPGSVHALLGPNGSGKSTLIKILAGVHSADGGSISIHGDRHPASRTSPGWAAAAGLHFVHQSIGAFPEMSVADNFALSSGYAAPPLGRIRSARLLSRVRTALQAFDIDVAPDATMGSLSVATQTMLAVARALEGRAEDARAILVFDEPTAAMPAREAEAVLQVMRDRADRGQTVVFVSHRLDEVLSVASELTVLRDGRHHLTRSADGATRDELITAFTGEHNPATLATREESPARMTGLRSSRLRVEDLWAGPLAGASLTVDAGEVVGISGLLGSGRSTFLRALFGLIPWTDGTLSLDGTAVDVRDPAEAIAHGLALIPENRARDGIFADRDVTTNYTVATLKDFWRRGRVSHAAQRWATESMLTRHSVRAPSSQALLAHLSGGNQQKVVAARWLDQRPRVLLLDEPTQGVDVGARHSLHELIRSAARDGAAVVVVSSDAEELSELSDRVVGLLDGRIAGEAGGADITPRRCLELALPPERTQTGCA